MSFIPGSRIATMNAAPSRVAAAAATQVRMAVPLTSGRFSGWQVPKPREEGCENL